MKLLLVLCAFLAGLAAGVAADAPAHIVILTVEDPSNYNAVEAMRGFAEKEIRSLGHRVTQIVGNKPEPTDFPGLIGALKDADLLILFVRRATPAKEQLAALRAHLEAGKPLLGIRTANHGFIPLKPLQDERLASWPEFTPEVLGGQNAGYEKRGLPYTVTAFPETAESPLLKGVHAGSIRGHGSLYKVLPLASDATPLLLGAAQGQPAQPIAWTRLHGRNKARVFYTSLGHADDMVQPDVRQLLLNAVKWTLEK